VARLCSSIIPRVCVCVCVYIYDLLKYNENIRAGRGLIHFISSRTRGVFFYSRLDFTANGARVIIHFARRPLACKHNIIYNNILYRYTPVKTRLPAFQMSFFDGATSKLCAFRDRRFRDHHNILNTCTIYII